MSHEQRFQRSLFYVMKAAQTTRDTAAVSASALAELAVVCEEMAARADPPRDQGYRDMAARLRDSSRRQTEFVARENEAIRRLFGDYTAPP